MIFTYAIPPARKRGSERNRISFNVVFSPSRQSSGVHRFYYENDRVFISGGVDSGGDLIYDKESFVEKTNAVRKRHRDALFWLEYEVNGKKYSSPVVPNTDLD